MKKITTMALLLAAAFQSQAGEIKITTHLTGFSEDAVIYLLNGATPLAYQTLGQGTVELTADVPDTPTHYSLYVVENNQPYYTTLFVADETIEVTANKEDMTYNAKVTGSKYHADKVLLDEMQAPIRHKLEVLQQEVVALQQSGEWEKPGVKEKYMDEDSEMEQLQKAMKQTEVQFILEHLDTAFAVSLLDYNVAALNQEAYRAIYNKMTPEQQQSEVGHWYQVASTSKKLEQGDRFIEIAATDKDQKAVKLSDYFNQGKEYVLLDLSGVNCPSSRQALPITKAFADKNTDKLQVVTVLQSPDAQSYQPFGALSTENWALLYAENYMNSDTYIKYQENGTPTFLLFDQSGKLIDRWNGLVYHQEKMEQYFGK